jgi:hypothetical protein
MSCFLKIRPKHFVPEGIDEQRGDFRVEASSTFNKRPVRIQQRIPSQTDCRR